MDYAGDDEERVALARAEAEALEQAERRIRLRESSTDDLSHMPVPIRESIASFSRWNIKTEVHARFCEFCRSSGNAKTVATETIFPEELPRGFYNLCSPPRQGENPPTVESERSCSRHAERSYSSSQIVPGRITAHRLTLLVPLPAGRCHHGRPRQSRLAHLSH